MRGPMRRAYADKWDMARFRAIEIMRAIQSGLSKQAGA